MCEFLTVSSSKAPLQEARRGCWHTCVAQREDLRVNSLFHHGHIAASQQGSRQENPLSQGGPTGGAHAAVTLASP